jgi:hypothetical protein
MCLFICLFQCNGVSTAKQLLNTALTLIDPIKKTIELGLKGDLEKGTEKKWIEQRREGFLSLIFSIQDEHRAKEMPAEKERIYPCS